MTIIRAVPQVVAVSRAMIEDESLSWGARGLMVYIDSMPEHAPLSPEHLLEMSGNDHLHPADRREELAGLIDELLAAGYLEKQ